MSEEPSQVFVATKASAAVLEELCRIQARCVVDSDMYRGMAAFVTLVLACQRVDPDLSQWVLDQVAPGITPESEQILTSQWFAGMAALRSQFKAMEERE